MISRKIIFLAFLLANIFLLGFLVLAYKSEPTHSRLTEKSARVFNQFYGNDLSENDIQEMIIGSIKEDTPPRWINHFFDPTTNQGWIGERMGQLSAEAIQRISLIGLSQAPAVSALDWAHNQVLQDRYLYYQGNQTWQKAIADYAQGNKKGAYRALGHILHLAADLTVPAHTRQDTHFDGLGDPGEPYEEWLGQNTDLSHLNNLDPQKSNFQCSDLDDCLKKLARYSNENFFSEDTILDRFYQQPIVEDYIILNNQKYAIKKDKNGNLIYLFVETNKGFSVDDPFIHRAYWQRLSEKAVLASVEIIRIFHEEAARAENDKSLIEPAPDSASNFYQLLMTGMLPAIRAPHVEIPVFSLYGSFSKIVDFFKSAGNSIFGLFQDDKDKLSASINLNLPNDWLSIADNYLINNKIQPSLLPISQDVQPSQNLNSSDNSLFPINQTNQPISENQPFSDQDEELLEKSPEEPLPEPDNFLPFSVPPGTGQHPIFPEPESFSQTPAQENPVPDSVPESQVVDLTPPSAITDLSAEPGPSRGSINLFWTAPIEESGLKEYIIKYATSSPISIDDWIIFDVLSASTSPSFLAGNLTPGQNYYWAIQSRDLADNLSEISNCASSTSQARAENIVISEVSTQGPQGAKDEFIELYNPTDRSINLGGWSLQYAGAQATTTWHYKYFMVNGASVHELPDIELGAGYYYLLTSATSSYSYQMSPDLTAVTIAGQPTSLGLADSGGRIRLINQDREEIDLFTWDIAIPWEVPPLTYLDSSEVVWSSFERRAAADSRAEQMAVLGEQYYQGNSYDTNNALTDFVRQPWPNPQNSFSDWSNGRLVSRLTRLSGVSPVVALDSFGNPAVVYYEYTYHGSGPERNLFTRFENGRWNYPVVLSCLTPGACSCQIDEPGCLWPYGLPIISVTTKDQNDVFHVFFSANTSPWGGEKSEIYWTRLENGVWSVPENISQTASTSSLGLWAEVDQNNQIHLVWTEDQVADYSEIYYAKIYFNGNTWIKSMPVNVSQSPGAGSINPVLGIDSSNQVYAFWYDSKDPENSGIYFSPLLSDSQWASSTMAIKTLGSGIVPLDRFSLAVDEQNNFHLVWSEKIDTGQTHIFYSRGAGDLASWSQPKELFDELEFIYKPQMVLVNNRPYVFASGRNFSNEDLNIYFTHSDSSGNIWSGPVNLYQRPTEQFLVSQALWDENKGLLYLFWFDDTRGDYRVFVGQMKIE